MCVIVCVYARACVFGLRLLGGGKGWGVGGYGSFPQVGTATSVRHVSPVLGLQQTELQCANQCQAFGLCKRCWTQINNKAVLSPSLDCKHVCTQTSEHSAKRSRTENTDLNHEAERSVLKSVGYKLYSFEKRRLQTVVSTFPVWQPPPPFPPRPSNPPPPFPLVPFLPPSQPPPPPSSGVWRGVSRVFRLYSNTSTSSKWPDSSGDRGQPPQSHWVHKAESGKGMPSDLLLFAGKYLEPERVQNKLCPLPASSTRSVSHNAPICFNYTETLKSKFGMEMG